VTRAQTETLLDKIRKRIPGVSVRTTMIVGFPGETEPEFEELVEFVRGFEFDALGVFPYSLEKETPSGRMKDQLPEPLKAQRVERLMLAQQEAAFARADRWRGRSFEVLVDGPKHKGVQPARHAGQAPEVDSVTLIKGGAFEPGEFVEVRCTGRREYDLTALPTRVALPTLG
jgi:ribosomal protein S12 methylthiotransferase